MHTVTILRKPLGKNETVASNSLATGCGGINVDGCRVGYTSEADKASATPQGKCTSHDTGAGIPVSDQTSAWQTFDRPPLIGRWPANLIYSHLEGCQCLGTKQVKPSNGSGVARHANHANGGSAVYGLGSSTGKAGICTRPDQTFLGAGGTETVQNWVCEEMCPVRQLDAQSGVLTSGKVSSHHMRNSSTQPSRGGFAGGFKDVPLTGYGDTGGASRFFKQVIVCS